MIAEHVHVMAGAEEPALIRRAWIVAANATRTSLLISEPARALGPHGLSHRQRQLARHTSIVKLCRCKMTSRLTLGAHLQYKNTVLQYANRFKFSLEKSDRYELI